MLLLPTLVVTLLWSITPIIQKYALNTGISHVTVMAISGAAYFTCLVWYIFYNSAIVIKDIASKKDTLTLFAAIAFTGAVCGFLSNVVYFYLLKNNDAYVVTALVSTAPLATAVLAILFLGESVTLIHGLGVACIVLGCVLLVTGSSFP